jgi:uncharacterized membrane protein
MDEVTHAALINMKSLLSTLSVRMAYYKVRRRRRRRRRMMIFNLLFFSFR